MISGASGGQNERSPSTAVPLKGTQNVYWTLGAIFSSYPQVQFAHVPLREDSNVTTIYGNSYNTLKGATALHLDAAGRLWVLDLGIYGGSPETVDVFDLPLTDKSTPRYTFVLSGTAQPQHLTFDASGNLWVTNNAYDSYNLVLEYTGPFNKSGTLSPALTLSQGIDGPAGIAFDKSGNLYVSSSFDRSIAVFTSPISQTPSYFLKDVDRPGGLIFDPDGNLYASDNYTSLSAIVRYNANNLKRGAHPNIVDRKRLHEIYEADFAFTAAGDLYFSNCGTYSSIYWYPTSKTAFSHRLAPAADYSNSLTGECVWGIAIK